MGKDSTNSGIPVFGELINLLDKHEISKIADKLKSDRYTKRLDSYQHLVIMLYATLGQFNSLREVELGFLSSATRMNHFGLDYMVRRSTLSDANRSGSMLLLSDEEISGLGKTTKKNQLRPLGFRQTKRKFHLPVLSGRYLKKKFHFLLSGGCNLMKRYLFSVEIY